MGHVVCTVYTKYVRVRAGGVKCWRVLRGDTLMNLIGYGRTLKTWPDHVIQLLTGNAFSGYACGPVLIALLQGLGKLRNA